MPTNVVITGCSSGFGRILVRLYLEAGWKVFAGLRRVEERRADFSAELQSYGDKLQLLSCEMQDEHSLSTFASICLEQSLGQIHAFIANAGFGSFGPGESTEAEELRSVMETNFFGTVSLTRKFLPALRSTQGHLVVLSSVMGTVGFPLSSSYCASKFALEGYFESLAYELRPLGVKVCLVEPGGHRTNFLPNSSMAGESELATSPYAPQILGYKAMQAQIAQRKPIAPDPVCRRILALTADPKPPLRTYCGLDAQVLRMLHKFLPRNPLVAGLGAMYQRLLTRMATKGARS